MSGCVVWQFLNPADGSHAEVDAADGGYSEIDAADGSFAFLDATAGGYSEIAAASGGFAFLDICSGMEDLLLEDGEGWLWEDGTPGKLEEGSR